MRRQPSPTHRPGQAKLVKPFRIVIHNAPRQHLPLPGIRRNLKPLQLPQHFQRAPLARNLRPRRHMLPAQQPLHELRRRNRLDLLAQRGNSQPMNASQQPPLAPFRLVLM